jgi:hypothetical protein
MAPRFFKEQMSAQHYIEIMDRFSADLVAAFTDRLGFPFWLSPADH